MAKRRNHRCSDITFNPCRFTKTTKPFLLGPTRTSLKHGSNDLKVEMGAYWYFSQWHYGPSQWRIVPSNAQGELLISFSVPALLLMKVGL